MIPKTIRESVIGLILGAVLMGLFYWGIPNELLSQIMPHDGKETVVFLLFVINGPLLAILIHEMGHVFFALIQGFTLQLFVVGFLGLKRIENRLLFYFNRDLQLFGGIAATTPPVEIQNLRWAFIRILAGGPIFSLLFGIGLILLFIENDTVFKLGYGITGVISIGLFLVTTLPSRSGIFFTDRKRIQRLINPALEGEIELTWIKLSSQLIRENSFVNLPIEDIRRIQLDTDPTVKFWGWYYEYKKWETIKDWDKAKKVREKLEEFKAYIPQSIWKNLDIQRLG